MEKIVIIHHEPLTKKIKRNFFVDELRTRGAIVEYWAVHRLLFKTLHLVDEIDDPDYIIIDTFHRLKKKIIENKDCFFIVEFTTTVKSYKILYYLTKYGCKVSAMGIHSSINFSFKEKLFNIRNYGFNKIFPFFNTVINNTCVLLLKCILPLKKMDVFFYCGSSSFSQANSIDKIPINSFDFEDYKRLLNVESIPADLKGRKYAVFLDEFLPFHPDIRIWGKQSLNPEKYYLALNRFFSYLEQKYSLEVVIAAHPKSNYDDSFFKGRKLFKYRTAELVKYSCLVLAHDSLSISFPVLNYKPILFVYLSDFYCMGTSIMALIKKNAKILGTDTVCIDNQDYQIKNIEYVDQKKYDDYKYSFLTSKEAENSLNADIIYSYFCR